MAQTTSGREVRSPRRSPAEGTAARQRTPVVARTTARTKTEPNRPKASPADGSLSADRPWLGQWNSAVTSYYLLIGATALLLVIGLVMVLSSSSVTSIAAGHSPYQEFLEQTQFALIGLPVIFIAARIPASFYRRYSWLLLLGAMGLQALTFVPGVKLGKNGNTGWIHFGGFTMQPAELAKLALAIWLGAVLGRKQRLLGRWSHAIIPAVPGALLIIGLVLGGHDLGTALVMMLLVAGAFFVAGVDVRLLALGGAAAAAIVGYVFIYGQGTGDRIGRILSTYGGACDVTSDCYQTLHGLWGLGTGGFGGVGLGAGREKWSYLPEAHNDFIFSVIGEELGLLGTLLVLALFAVLGLAMSRVIRRHTDPFAKITTAAIACWIVGQALINIGVVIGILPVIGLPLPLVSAGGSALIMTMAALGVVISFARTEPGAAEALAARGSVVRKSLAVVGRASRRALPRRGSRA